MLSEAEWMQRILAFIFWTCYALEMLSPSPFFFTFSFSLLFSHFHWEIGRNLNGKWVLQKSFRSLLCSEVCGPSCSKLLELSPYSCSIPPLQKQALSLIKTLKNSSSEEINGNHCAVMKQQLSFAWNVAVTWVSEVFWWLFSVWDIDFCILQWLFCINSIRGSLGFSPWYFSLGHCPYYLVHLIFFLLFPWKSWVYLQVFTYALIVAHLQQEGWRVLFFFPQLCL